MPVHVELSNLGDDADELETVLRAAGFEVARVALGELGRHGSASVVDVSQTGAESAIEALLARSPHPVVRLGGPSHVDGMLPRPVGHDALLVALRRALASRHRELVAPTDQAITVTQDVGRTFSPGIEVSTLGAGLPTLEGEGVETRPSEALERVLRAEGGEALFVQLSGGQRDDPLELAPDVLFDFPLGPGDGPEHEHALTALERALPDLSASDPPVVTEPPGSQAQEPERNAQEGWLALDDPTLGNPDPTGRFRAGQTSPLGMVRLLWRIAELGLDLELDAHFDGQRLLLRYLAGGVRELRGAAHQRLLQEVAPTQSAGSEREAQALIEGERVAGRLSKFEIDRGLRLAHEALLSELALASSASFTLRPLSAKDLRRLAESAAPLARPALVQLTAAARRDLGRDTLDRLAGGARRVRLGPEARGRMQQAEIEPELRDTLLRHDGSHVDAILEEVGEGVGVEGLLCVLAVLDAARFVRESSSPT